MVDRSAKYSAPDFIRLGWSIILTRIFFRSARLIRQPARIRGYANMKIGSGFTTGQYCRIEAAYVSESSPSLKIGKNVQMNDACHVAALKSISIGDNVLIASQVFITDHDHGDVSSLRNAPFPRDRELKHSPVVIGDNVWIGEKAIILKGVTIGTGAVIGAGSVVTRDIPCHSVAVGVPARIV